MKKSFFSIFIFVSMLFLNIKNDVWAYNTKNQSVNSLIGDVSFIQKYGEQPNLTTSENLRIQTHLEYVENLLSSKDVSVLPTGLQKQRTKMLGLLHEYRTNGYFPKNYDYPGERKSCFIDKDGNICAVGYLVAQTAGIEVAKKINSFYQYAKIYEMKLPELDEWIANSGLTKEECAMIQPYYGYYGVDSMKLIPCSQNANCIDMKLIVYNNREISPSFPMYHNSYANGNNNITIDHYQGLPLGLMSFVGPVHVIDTFYINSLEAGQYEIKYNFWTYILPANDTPYPANQLMHSAAITFNAGMTNQDETATCNPYLYVYPNPSDGHFTVTNVYPLEANTYIRLYDLTGREIKRAILPAGIANAEMDCSDLHEGTYFYSVCINDTARASQKLVIIK